VAVTILSGDSPYSRASQWPVKAALRRDVASKAAFSRDLPSLSENPAVTIANQTQNETNPSPWVCAVSITDEVKPGSRKGASADHRVYGKI